MGIKRTEKNKDLPNNLHIANTINGVTYYKYKNPKTKQFEPMGSNRKIAIEAAKQLNSLLTEEAPLIQKILNPHTSRTLSEVITEYIEFEIPNKPWDKGTIVNNVARLNKIKRGKISQTLITMMDRIGIAEWLEEIATSNDTFNKYLDNFIDLYAYAISKKYIDYNEAEKVRRKSLSKKIKANQKKRKRLTTEAFWEIHKTSPEWLQIAMELSLITLQSRLEIINLKYTDIRDNQLFVIRDKVSAVSDYGFIKIGITPQIDNLIKQSRNNIASPYIIHYSPRRRQRKQMEAKPHWTSVLPDYLTKQFKKHRDQTGLFDDWPPEEKPGFHEIRSLGSRIYEEMGYSKRYIQFLLSHSDKKTSQIYLEGGELTDDNYISVSAEMDIRKIPNL